jgi:hypothetical protein
MSTVTIKVDDLKEIISSLENLLLTVNKVYTSDKIVVLFKDNESIALKNDCTLFKEGTQKCSFKTVDVIDGTKYFVGRQITSFEFVRELLDFEGWSGLGESALKEAVRNYFTMNMANLYDLISGVTNKINMFTSLTTLTNAGLLDITSSDREIVETFMELDYSDDKVGILLRSVFERSLHSDLYNILKE